MTLRVSNWQSQSDLDSVRNSCDVFLGNSIQWKQMANRSSSPRDSSSCRWCSPRCNVSRYPQCCNNHVCQKKRPGGCGWHKFLKPEPDFNKKVPQTPASHLAPTVLGRHWDNVRDRDLYVEAPLGHRDKGILYWNPSTNIMTDENTKRQKHNTQDSDGRLSS